MAEHKDILVLVLSRNYSTALGVIRSLGAAGYTVDLIAAVMRKGSSEIASSSKYVRNAMEIPLREKQQESSEDLLNALLSYKDEPSEKVIFPTDDFTAAVMDENRSVLEEYFILPRTEGSYSITQLMNKDLQGKLAKEAGLAIPSEWEISLREEISIPEDMVYPCFVKPVQSFSGYKKEMRKCEDELDLKVHLEKLKRINADRSVLVQEYLNIEKEYDFSGVCLDERIVIPGVIEKTHIARHERGVTMAGRMKEPEVLGDALSAIVEMLKKFRYVGMFDFELNLCGEKLYFNEVNLRSGGPNYSYFLNGANLPAVIVSELTGEGHSLEDETIREFGKSFVYERMAWEDYIYSFMTAKERDACIKGADYTLLADEKDPEPGKRFLKKIKLSAKKHQLLKLLGRE